MFLWRAGDNAGIVAAGRVLTTPAELPDDEGSREFIRRPERFEGTACRVELEITEILIDDPITKTEARADAELADLLVIRQPQATNFAVTPAQLARLERIIAQRIGK